MDLPWYIRDEISQGPRTIPAAELERLAARAIALAGTQDPERIAAALGIPVHEWKLPPETPSVLTSDGEIRVSRALNRLERRRAIYHELAHVLLRWFHLSHTHTDVWLLTVILSGPGEPFLRYLRADNDDGSIVIALTLLVTFEG